MGAFDRVRQRGPGVVSAPAKAAEPSEPAATEEPPAPLPAEVPDPPAPLEADPF